MAIYTNSYNPNWKKVSGNYKKELEKCTRCGNNVQYEMCFESEGVGFGNAVLFATKKYYAYKCPICPNFEPIPSELAKAIMKG
jgi:hypothetical protein